jgi:peptide/nickel transport system permease protein/oligopeptide transport system permease protein
VGLFVDRIINYSQGDFGIDFNERAITALIADAAPITIRLTLIAVLFEAVVGILAGVLAGIRKDGVTDNLIRIATTLVISVPVFVLGVSSTRSGTR